MAQQIGFGYQRVPNTTTIIMEPFSAGSRSGGALEQIPNGNSLWARFRHSPRRTVFWWKTSARSQSPDQQISRARSRVAGINTTPESATRMHASSVQQRRCGRHETKLLKPLFGPCMQAGLLCTRSHVQYRIPTSPPCGISKIFITSRRAALSGGSSFLLYQVVSAFLFKTPHGEELLLAHVCMHIYEVDVVSKRKTSTHSKRASE